MSSARRAEQPPASGIPALDRLVRACSLVAVIAASLTLAVLWIYLIPILEASDESEHFDYVISLTHAGRMIAADNAASYPSYDYDTSFLQTYTSFSRINLNSRDRVPPGYGSHEYFARIDRRSLAQLPDRWKFDPSIHSPALLPFYPFGYYGLAAVWLHSFPMLRDSLVATFYAARWLSVALLGITLAFTYATAREVALRPWAALAFTAIIGMFSLTTFVASYVQPDNLTWTTYSIIMFLSLRLRKRVHLGEIAALGAAFGVLAITKYQYFACAATAVLPLALIRLARCNSAARALGAVALLAFPSAVTFFAQARFVGSNPAFTNTEASHVHISASFFTLAWQAFWHFFVAGFNNDIDADPHFSGATSYWGDSGWLDTPITFGNASVDSLVRLIIQTLNVAVIGLTVVWLTGTIVRLGRIALRGRAVTALQLAASNAPMNLYFVFIAFMIVFYALTNNSWHMSGRLWLPLIAPAFLLGFRYAPRALRNRRWRRIVGGAIFACLAAYSTVGSFFATASARERYYGPEHVPALSSLRKGPATELVIASVTTSQDPPRAPVDSAGNFIGGVRQGQQIEVVGWASDPVRRSAAGGVIALVDERDEVVASYGYATQDVSEALHNFLFFWAGYHFYIPTENLAYGPHTISFYVVSKDLTTAYRATRSVRVIVDPPRPIVIGDHQHIVGSLDQVGPVARAAQIGPELDPVWLKQSDRLLLRGWADDVVHPQSIERIVVTVDGKRSYAARLGDVRPELIRTFPNLPPSVAMYSGYTALIAMHDLREGMHRFSMTAYDGRTRAAVTLIDHFVFGVYNDTSPAMVKPAYADRPFKLADQQHVSGSVDFVGPADDVNVSARGGAVFIDKNDFLFVRGWAMGARGRPLGKLYLVLDGTHRYPMHTGAFRLDYAQQTPTDASSLAEAYAGFNVAVPLRTFSTGAHHFSIVRADAATRREVTLVTDFGFAIY